MACKSTPDDREKTRTINNNYSLKRYTNGWIKVTRKYFKIADEVKA